jgi:hypothetical protein
MKRPTVAMVFGILNIVFGAFGLFGLATIGTSFAVSPIMGIISIVSVCVSVILLLAGLTLVINKKIALDLNKYYAMLSLLITIINAVYLTVTAGIAGLMVAIVAILIGIIYPLLIWLFVVKNKAVQQFYGSQK